LRPLLDRLETLELGACPFEDLPVALQGNYSPLSFSNSNLIVEVRNYFAAADGVPG
jgi:hypothetical protein